MYADLMRKYHRIIRNYYIKYLSGFDAALMREVVMVSEQFCVWCVDRGRAV